MFEVTVRDSIASAHQLPGYDGPCKDMHGHTWKVEVSVAGHTLDKVGLLTDFKVLKDKLKKVLMPLDHVVLNDLPAFKGLNPSTENIARHVYRAMREACAPLEVKQVQVWESETASVVYYE
ncbi:MAG: 6-carboxytetrahydropterin synthase QueD [Candidatus Omnitrophica bacterium]|nr:6-carboxytetrahydropterin synthase QueD [Candidatus Omnitrophota bacterium]MDE2008735.1 6-carboxytetrahydropterin synthase QueD [Candidatus Omnitrophota bacterium]MDE2215159.1 6-carboxytetrahydropterin synthase QueD [Candidatus Omnitrophota bacterium]MDE2232162.1 6-carboxytetrahydropterin synthase QueD [Candidatus Omnitrophota bacterium]